ncbi:cytochrome c biogenesis protein ResB [Paenarthrobacter aurescens]|uniref:Cytochrome c biogenesis protein ResB n=1 Tax=Paenarthrobacter aurescens TaxID=43663 RepID=A0A4Y3N7Z0_PAEAU|nr:cytochrome c biogenesis protein ResB [Paenarthrobacter aurescens]MDO6144665.1 cytochrome c biogenesis protein ResB [Paenarthrobacter aurescens]MDO6148510.1 cytochrome c biogenesis protein ResB [Paenarthrobacter aurescens]MDO6159756.1 cytochrome c biogenesis protein ResB [Paenarthrobacter aurescens]MDO6163620.1 cytochrome c biogenesis protein ResB [Paenarthrobacter aurescens]GEB17672.1 cytochrome c biogenesis protein ResB [Paenarthrobacter aurescens]
MSESVKAKKKSPAAETPGTAEGKLQQAKSEAALPALGFKGMLRWAWTQLTSMRTALFLLLLLAVGAVPGSLFPQRPANPVTVTDWIKNNPTTGPFLDALQMFDVYSSAWFSAIYILLFISLIGCVTPRAIAHYKAMKSQPPRTPKRLSRLPEYGTLAVPADAGIPASKAIADAAGLLKKRGYRVEVRDVDGALPSLGAERGFLKEVGNLVFHTSLIGVLVSVAIGGLYGYSGQRILVEGDTFVNTLVGYDQFTPGTNFQSSWLQPYSMQLDKFQATFDRGESPGKAGQPIDYTAEVTTKETKDSAGKKEILKVNDPVSLGGTSLYLTGNGYAPMVTVRDGEGNVSFEGPVIAKVQGDNYYSSVVIKVPDAKPDQLGFVGFFLPTAFSGENGTSFSASPELFNPQLSLNSFYGDLGLDKGVPQNVFELDVKNLKPLNARDLAAGGITLTPGATVDLPDGKGSITFDGVKKYIGVDIHHNPGQLYALIFGFLAVAGLVMSLYINRRRVWVRTGTHADGRTMVEYGLLARGEDHRLAGEAAALREIFAREWNVPETPDTASKTAGSSSTSKDQ